MNKQDDHFLEFANTVKDIDLSWTYWWALFEDAPQEDLDVLRRSAGQFFSYMHRHLIGAVILGLCRLADPEEMSGRGNITLEVVFNETDFGGRRRLRQRATYAKNRALKDISAMKPLRNRVLAHFDEATAMGREDIPDIPIEVIRTAVYSVANFCERIRAARTGQPADPATGRGMFAPLPSDAIEEVHHLRDLLRAGLERGEGQR